LLRKHCKEGASVATQFLTNILINFQKNLKIEKNNENPQNIFLIYFHHFSIVSKEFKFSKILGTRSTFNALFLKSLIFLIESMLILFVFRKIQKNKKNQNLQKRRS
jgi:hypothetical protein